MPVIKAGNAPVTPDTTSLTLDKKNINFLFKIYVKCKLVINDCAAPSTPVTVSLIIHFKKKKIFGF